MAKIDPELSKVPAELDAAERRYRACSIILSGMAAIAFWALRPTIFGALFGAFFGGVLFQFLDSLGNLIANYVMAIIAQAGEQFRVEHDLPLD